MSLRVVTIGSGNVASHLAPAIEKSGVGKIVQVYSRNLESAEILAANLRGAVAVASIDSIIPDADVYLISLVDDAVAPFVSEWPYSGNALWLHTSGSVPMDVLAPLSDRYGVFYPLQTFSKGVELDIAEIPLFIEGNNELTEQEIRRFAAPVFANIYHADSERRGMMHIAAVFGCNFVNFLWTIASGILEKENLPFDVLRPLLEETMKKTFAVSPERGQTGPAVRGDIRIIEKHLSFLSGQPQEIYRLLSDSIIAHYSALKTSRTD